MKRLPPFRRLINLIGPLFLILSTVTTVVTLTRHLAAASATIAVPLPADVQAVWSPSLAHRDTTPTRQRLCLNGLWRWQPAAPEQDLVPASNWGYFKVPGSWPGITDYMQKDSQTVWRHPAWQTTSLGQITAAWYEREFTVPSDWTGRRIAIATDTLNSFALVHLDGHRVGELRFPGGELDITADCQPGKTHRLSLLVVALPLQGVMMSYNDSASARQVKGQVARRGLCGDVFLMSHPSGPHVIDVAIDTSVRRQQITLTTTLTNLQPNVHYVLQAQFREPEQAAVTFTHPPFSLENLDGHSAITFAVDWKAARLWDVHTPQNQCNVTLTLQTADGLKLDTFWNQRFGFREFWIDGRDLYLNGTRIALSTVPLDNAQIGSALATYAAARESLERLKTFGIRFVYTHNYGCEPGAHLAFEEILRAADDAGVLVALSQPHFSHYDWASPDADATNGYAGHAAFYARYAGNHPSVVMYAMSHNATGYNEDMNPDMIDGIQDARDNWAARNAKLAQRAETIVKRLDPRRIVYHLASGNLGPMHPVNFYPNFVPIQEMSDWFEHWAIHGVKPVFLCEYGAPFTWDWTMYRGWFEGQREFGSARVPWEFCLAEWNAQFLGDQAFPASETEQSNLRWEARQFKAGNRWHRWDYPASVGSTRFDERYPIFAAYITDNWRAFRTWGVSITSPWEHEHFWKLRDGVDRSRRPLPVDWEHLQRPGFSPDFVHPTYERMDLAFERQDWIATPAAQALMRNNRPLLAWIAGKPARFTSKDHTFLPGETVEKQIILINDSREPAGCEVEWSTNLPLPSDSSGTATSNIPPGAQARLPVRFTISPDCPIGHYTLRARVEFKGLPSETQEDAFTLDVVSPPPPSTPATNSSIAVFDPNGETRQWLQALGLPTRSVNDQEALASHDILIIGKQAITVEGPAPDIRAVRNGLKVVLFEQSADVLEKRFGFRVASYGLRHVFPRVVDHPFLEGITAEHLRDWRGAATLLPSTLQYEMRPRHGPTVNWCDLPVTRLWRCGNRGNVASVLIEKPPRGDFLPVIDGGYSLQYSPLLEYREGAGLVVFCQMDVTGRTEQDPTAERLARNILRHVFAWKPTQSREAVYWGDSRGQKHLQSLGIEVAPFPGGEGLSAQHLLVLGAGTTTASATDREAITSWMQSGGTTCCIGLSQTDIAAWPSLKAMVKPQEHISVPLPRFGLSSAFAGISPADLHNRDPRTVALVMDGATTFGRGTLAEQPQVYYCQLAPWEFYATNQMNLKRTHRRVSFAVSRLLANLGVRGKTPILERCHRPVQVAQPEKRWLDGLYLDAPEEWDDPYRFFRW